MTTLRKVDTAQVVRSQRPKSAFILNDPNRAPAWLIRLGMALLAVTLLGVTVFTQVKLSAYAATGGGAAQVSAPPLIVAISLLASFGAALLLGGDDLLRGLRRLSHLRWHSPFPLLFSFFSSIRRGGWGVRFAHLTTRHYLVLFGVMATLIVSLLADIYALNLFLRPLAQWLWVGSVVLLLVIAWLSHAGIPVIRNRASLRFQRVLLLVRDRLMAWAPDLLALMILTVGALALRLPGLSDIPYVVHGDEAACGLEALRWLDGGVPSLLSVGWYGLP